MLFTLLPEEIKTNKQTKIGKGVRLAAQNPFHGFWCVLERLMDMFFIKVMCIPQLLGCRFLSSMSVLLLCLSHPGIIITSLDYISPARSDSCE